MDKQEAIYAIKLFNEKVDKLINSGFVRHFREKGLNVTLKSQEGKTLEVSGTLPEQDDIDAFILNIRFFIQDNEASSLRNMTEVYNQISIPLCIKDDFNFARDKLNSEFAKKSSFHLDGKNLSRRDIFDTIIYGGLAHANPTKKQDFDKWMGMEPLKALIVAEFSNLLVYFLDCIAYIKKANLRALEQLK